MNKITEIINCFLPQPQHPIIGAIIATIEFVGVVIASCFVLIQIGALEKFEPSISIGLSIVSFALIMFSLFIIRNFQSTNPEIPFKYDHNGVLWHGNQPNIALRVKTFLEMLRGIIESEPDEKKQAEVLINTGKKMGERFGQEFINVTYPTEINKGGVFNSLKIEEKLKHWTIYDSSTGWGKIESEIKDGLNPPNLSIKASHLDLYRIGEGDYFSHIMAGYIEALIKNILDQQYCLESYKRLNNYTFIYNLSPLKA
jgi:hypothetical protein